MKKEQKTTKIILLTLITFLAFSTVNAQEELQVENTDLEEGDWVNDQVELELRFLDSDSDNITVYFEDETGNTGINGTSDLLVVDGGQNDETEDENGEFLFTVTADAEDSSEFVAGENLTVDITKDVGDGGPNLAKNDFFQFDNQPPEFSQAVTGETLSGNNQERMEITVEFNNLFSPIDSSTVDGSSFTLTDGSVDDARISEEDENSIILTVGSQLDTNATPTVEATNPDFADAAGNVIDSTQEINAENGLSPVVKSFSVTNTPINSFDDGNDEELTIEFSEEIGQLSFNLIDTGNIDFSQETDSNPEYVYNLDISDDQENIIQIDVVNTEDMNDNTIEENPEETFIVDTIPPTLEDLNYTSSDTNDGYIGEGSEVDFEVSVTDGLEVDSVEAKASDFGIDTNLNPLGEDVYEGSFTVDESTAGPEGKVDLNVSAFDFADNQGNLTDNSLVLDTQGPQFVEDSAELVNTGQIKVEVEDTGGNGNSSGINNPGLVDSSDFTVTDQEGNDVSINSVDEEGGQGDTTVEFTLNLESGQLKTSSEPIVNSNSLEDAVGNAIDDSITASNLVSPKLNYAVVNEDLSNSGSTKIDLVFSEDIGSQTGKIDINASKGELDVEESIGPGGNVVTTVYKADGTESPLQTGNNIVIESDEGELTNINDNDGNIAEVEGEVIISTFRRELKEGWNLVSFPIASNQVYDFSEIVNMDNVETVWRYEPEEDNPWTSDNTNSFDGFEGGQGYLIELQQDQVIAPTVDNLIDGGDNEFVFPASQDISEGWNLVGHYQEFTQDADKTDTGAFASLGDVFGNIYAQDQSGQISYRGVQTVEPGKAYWISTQGDLSSSVIPYTENQQN